MGLKSAPTSKLTGSSSLLRKETLLFLLVIGLGLRVITSGAPLGGAAGAGARSARCSAPPAGGMRYGCRARPARGALGASRYNGSSHFMSQFGEDRALFEAFFYEVRGGSFLEMGALDGVRISNTRFFAEELGWAGLLVEGNPGLYRELRGNRRESIVVNALVCERAGEVHMIERNAVGGAYEFMSEEFKEKFHRGVVLSELPTVPCVPLGDILRRFEVRHVDLFSLDVEGAEAAVLSTVDFAQFSASVVVMEWGSAPSYTKALYYFLDAGYVQFPQGKFMDTNIVLVHPEFKKELDMLS